MCNPLIELPNHEDNDYDYHEEDQDYDDYEEDHDDERSGSICVTH